jgi:predicted nucleic acid-binding protein
MPNACFVDTNILLYAVDRNLSEKRKQARACLDALARHKLLIINPQVLNEYAHNVLKKMPHVSREQLLSELQAMREWCLAELTAETAAQAVVISGRYRLSFYDSALLASAITYGCDFFVSENMTHQQSVGALRVVSPFQGEFTSVLGIQ